MQKISKFAPVLRPVPETNEATPTVASTSDSSDTYGVLSTVPGWRASATPRTGHISARKSTDWWGAESLEPISRGQGPKPQMTRRSLKQWQKAASTPLEMRQRRAVAKQIKQAAINSNWLRRNEPLDVPTDLKLDPFREITSLPDGLHIAGNFSIAGWSKLKFLPEGLHVGGSLNLENCTALIRLPNTLNVGGHLYLDDCSNLLQVPEGLHVRGDLTLVGCDKIRRIRANVRVDGHMCLEFCTKLESIDAGLQVKGNLIAKYCPYLVFLDDGARIGGYLDFSNCPELMYLARDIVLGGNLDVTHCKKLTHLPPNIYTWGAQANGNCRHIYLTGSNIDATMSGQLQDKSGLSMNFVHHMPISRSRIGKALRFRL